MTLIRRIHEVSIFVVAILKPKIFTLWQSLWEVLRLL